MQEYIVHISVIAAAAVSATAVICDIIFTGKAEKKVKYMLDALEDGELNFRFQEKRKGSFNKTLNRIKKLYDTQRKEIEEKERYFGAMLDHVQTGIVAINDNTGQIIYANAMALAAIGIVQPVNIRQLRNICRPLAEAFMQIKSGEEREVKFATDFDQKTVSMSASSAMIKGNTVKIIAFNDISGSMEENEVQSWTKLIRVLTHEIMNTVTPIAALSETLLSNVSPDDMRTGLETISGSSRNLIKFIDSYRNLTKIPRPVKRPFYVKEIAADVIELTKEKTSASGASISFTELSDDILLYADDSQISRILINLVSNALQAGATDISITAELDSLEAVNIYVSNNGPAISKESQQEIFTPFYTTKPDGTGIGLSISRQIMHLHNGSLRLSKSDEKSTVFVLSFR